MNNYDIYERIRVDLRNRVLHLTLNRPEKLNAVDARMHAELATIFDAANLDPDVDIIVLGGAGRSFSAGGDADWMVELMDVEGEWKRKAVESRRIWLSLLDLEKPILCKIQGAVRGMCATIMSLCDVVIAAEDAHVADTHVDIGLAGADGCNAIWPFLLGYAKAKDLLFNATVLSAHEAERLGLVTKVVPLDALDREVDAYVAGLQTKPIRALQLTKMAVNFQMKQLVWPALESGLNLLELSNFSGEHRDRVDRFLSRSRKQPG